MSSPPWLSIEPRLTETRLMLSSPCVGTILRARLPPLPQQSAALGLLLRGLAAWLGQPFYAALDAEAEDVQHHPERWAQLLGELDDTLMHVEWVGYTTNWSGRDRFLEATGEFHRARRLITFAATGQR